jgi:hypothetical protein
MAPQRHPLRSYVLDLFRRGELVSIAEAVLISGASRQAVTKWIKAEGISIEARRLARIAKHRTNAQRHLDGLPPLRRPSKGQMRKDADKALRDWNAANAKPQ